MKEIKTIYWYIEKLKEIYLLVKNTPNDSALGTKIREYISKIKE